jgi:N-acyl-D-aspartate/D-glutamate deacylase
MDLVIQDGTRIGTIYFLMSEDNVRKQIAKGWVSFGSDEGSYAPEGVFLKSNPHPRAYGTFARFLGKYVRDERVIPLQEAVRRLSWLPLSNLGIKRRGRLGQGFFADIVVFNWPWWIRTTINGSKVRCPAIGRRASKAFSSAGLKPSHQPPGAKGALAFNNIEPEDSFNAIVTGS